MKKQTYRPGEIAPASGEYEIVGPRGGKGPERTAVQGEPLPPTPAKNSGYRLVRPARNGAGKARGK